jgi:hypothetical protein
MLLSDQIVLFSEQSEGMARGMVYPKLSILFQKNYLTTPLIVLSIS